MEIQHSYTGHKGRFFVEENGQTLAELVYWSDKPDIMVIDHTQVNPSLEGKGIGKQLVDRAVAYARAHEMHIMPQCPFARAVIDKTPEYQDVLVKS